MLRVLGGEAAAGSRRDEPGWAQHRPILCMAVPVSKASVPSLSGAGRRSGPIL